MITVKINVPAIRYTPPTATALRRLGAAAQDAVLTRVGRHQNADDQPARAYSPRGPIYVPNTGVQGRSKRALGGREVLSGADRRAIRAAGRGALIGKTRGGKTTRFENYAAYKMALGKSGQRDLELSGRMLGSVGIVRQSDKAVVLGFTREAEHLKAKGNQSRDPWFALSPKDVAAVERFAVQILDPRLAAD